MAQQPCWHSPFSVEEFVLTATGVGSFFYLGQQLYAISGYEAIGLFSLFLTLLILEFMRVPFAQLAIHCGCGAMAGWYLAAGVTRPDVAHLVAGWLAGLCFHGLPWQLRWCAGAFLSAGCLLLATLHLAGLK